MEFGGDWNWDAKYWSRTMRHISSTISSGAFGVKYNIGDARSWTLVIFTTVVLDRSSDYWQTCNVNSIPDDSSSKRRRLHRYHVVTHNDKEWRCRHCCCC